MPRKRGDRSAGAAVHPDPRVGRVHLKLADRGHAIAHHRAAPRFDLARRFGPGGAFRPAGGDHLAIRSPAWRAVARALRRTRAHRVEIHGAGNHGLGRANDHAAPDGNGIETQRDRDLAE